ncbi:hypothetical protein BD289DRAFT_194917 [Coniella lustricola]|uniref:Uncharacterized protein n=1 Tax=Coniella lustricola TaxID=2025994 RepID=A0A2T3AM32_9PEZI|nr:hypothetical protein BD289DRAFT_194917 [Coniella lustricola]
MRNLEANQRASSLSCSVGSHVLLWDFHILGEYCSSPRTKVFILSAVTILALSCSIFMSSARLVCHESGTGPEEEKIAQPSPAVFETLWNHYPAWIVIGSCTDFFADVVHARPRSRRIRFTLPVAWPLMHSRGVSSLVSYMSAQSSSKRGKRGFAFWQRTVV